MIRKGEAPNRKIHRHNMLYNISRLIAERRSSPNSGSQSQRPRSLKMIYSTDSTDGSSGADIWPVSVEMIPFGLPGLPSGESAGYCILRRLVRNLSVDRHDQAYLESDYSFEIA